MLYAGSLCAGNSTADENTRANDFSSAPNLKFDITNSNQWFQRCVSKLPGISVAPRDIGSGNFGHHLTSNSQKKTRCKKVS